MTADNEAIPKDEIELHEQVFRIVFEVAAHGASWRLVSKDDDPAGRIIALVRAYDTSLMTEYPKELTPALRAVLGMMLWECAPIAHVLRAAGHEIKAKAEDEQAAALHWLIGFVLEHGDGWRARAAAEIEEMARVAGHPIKK